MPSAEKEEEKDCLQHVKKDERERERRRQIGSMRAAETLLKHTHTLTGAFAVSFTKLMWCA